LKPGQTLTAVGPIPAAMRNAGILAVVLTFIAGGLLYQENVTSEAPPDFSRGGAFAGDLVNPGIRDLTVSTPEPRATPQSRSSAILTAPEQPPSERGITSGGPQFPAFGRYIYEIEGTESASVFGSREYPTEMVMTVHRSEGPGGRGLRRNELAFDLFFSEEHEEREIVAFGRDGISFTFEASSVTFGPSTQTSEATYEPPMVQVPIPLKIGEVVEGSSRAISPDGEELRVEDWEVEVQARDQIQILGEAVDTFVVEIKRQSRPGSSEQLTRTRKYWVDPARSIWLKFEEHTNGTQDVGFGSFSYRTDFTATLDRTEPL
jgi:hypothetical protein